MGKLGEKLDVTQFATRQKRRKLKTHQKVNEEKIEVACAV
jgi:hypothetical protein